MPIYVVSEDYASEVRTSRLMSENQYEAKQLDAMEHLLQKEKNNHGRDPILIGQYL